MISDTFTPRADTREYLPETKMPDWALVELRRRAREQGVSERVLIRRILTEALRR